MQSVAAEMNLSETTFLRGGGCEWELRWFLPVVEVDLCGHTTLASAHALWSTGVASAGETLRFATRSGILTASPTPEGGVALDFLAEPVHPVEAQPGLLDGLPRPGPRRRPISCRVSSHREPALMRIRSPGRRTVRWDRTGRSGSAGERLWDSSCRPAAGPSASRCGVTGSPSPAGR